MADKDNNMYRSSDDKFLAGVCSGLAHKLGFSKWGFIVGFRECLLCAVLMEGLLGCVSGS